MDELKLKFCIKLSEEFIKSAKAALEREKADGYALYGCKETGSCRRKSMDLTRALADLRKPRNYENK